MSVPGDTFRQVHVLYRDSLMHQWDAIGFDPLKTERVSIDVILEYHGTLSHKAYGDALLTIWRVRNLFEEIRKALHA